MKTEFQNNHAEPHRLERDARDIDQLLRRLPVRRAPADFLASTLAVVAAYQARPWYHRPWLRWPLHWQAMSFLTAGSLFIAWAWGAGVGIDAMTSLPSFVTTRASAAVFASTTWTLVQAMILAFINIPPVWLATFACVLGTAWISCLGLGTACWKLAAAKA